MKARNQRERAPVRRLHVDLDPVQSEAPERDVERERKALGHEPVARVRRERVIAEVRAVEGVAHDLGKVEYAAKGII